MPRCRRRYGPPVRLTLAAEAGFDFVEMSIDPSVQRLERLTWSSAQRRDVRDKAHDLGIPMLTMCLSAHRQYPLGSADKIGRARGMEILRQALDLASDLGIRIIQIAGYDTESGDTNGESQNRYIEAIQQASIWASELSIMLGLENQESGFVNSPSQALAVIEKVNSPYVQMYMDVGNLIVNRRDVRQEIYIAKGHLLAVHLKDARPDVPRRVFFGDGDVPFSEIFRLLAEIRFTGPLMLEMWNDNRPDAVRTSIAAREWIENCIAGMWTEIGYPPAFRV